LVFSKTSRPPLEPSRYSDSLRAGRSGDRITVGARFSAPVQTGPGAQPASYKMGTGSFQGVKRQERGAYNPPPPSAKVKERVGLYIYFPSEPLWPVIRQTLLLSLPLPLEPTHPLLQWIPGFFPGGKAVEALSLLTSI
jgi:hypothetical protein